MTVMIDTPRPADAVTAAAWFEVEPGFWVANTGGQHVGAVERLRAGDFTALDAIGAEVGRFASLADARGAVTSEVW